MPCCAEESWTILFLEGEVRPTISYFGVHMLTTVNDMLRLLAISGLINYTVLCI
jgi:hypothetical protein